MKRLVCWALGHRYRATRVWHGGWWWGLACSRCGQPRAGWVPIGGDDS